jgi:hypothetical protein
MSLLQHRDNFTFNIVPFGNQSINQSIYLSNLSIYLSICLSIQLPIYPSSHPSIHPSIHPSMILQPFVGPWLPFQFLDLFTLSIGLFERGNSPSQGSYLHTGQHKHRINAHSHPCLKCDSNPRSRCPSGRRQFMP